MTSFQWMASVNLWSQVPSACRPSLQKTCAPLLDTGQVKLMWINAFKQKAQSQMHDGVTAGSPLQTQRQSTIRPLE